MNLVEPAAVASFGAGAGATASILLGLSAPWTALAAASGGAVAVLLLARALGGRTAGSRRPGMVVAALGFFAIAGVVAALRMPAKGSVWMLALELAKVTGLMLAASAGVTGALFGVLAAVAKLHSRRRVPGGDPSA